MLYLTYARTDWYLKLDEQTLKKWDKVQCIATTKPSLQQIFPLDFISKGYRRECPSPGLHGPHSYPRIFFSYDLNDISVNVG